MVLGVLFLAAPVVSAQGPATSAAESEWTGGNGWCQDGICFRAWAGTAGVEVGWRVETDPARNLIVTRRALQPALDAAPVAIADSGSEGEFSYLDDDVAPGAIYLYELVDPDSAERLGDALEAGVAATASDPGGGAGSHLVYLPITLKR